MDHSDAETYDRMLLLAGTLPGACRYNVNADAVEQGRIAPLLKWGGPIVLDGDSLAYLTTRRASEQPSRWELGVFGHGPRGAHLAEDVAERLRGWDRSAEPRIELRAGQVSFFW